MEAIPRFWMKGRTVIMGQNINELYFDEILNYLETAVVNKFEEDEEVYTIDLFPPSLELQQADPSCVEDFMQKEKYADLMELDIAISAGMLVYGKNSFEKNRIEADSFNRFLIRPDQVTNNKVVVQIDVDALDESSIKALNKFCIMAKERDLDIKLVAYRGIVEKVDTGRVMYHFSREELAKLERVNSLVKKHFNRQLIYQAGASFVPRKNWQHNDVVLANERLEKLAQDLLALELSPAEMLAAIHKYVASFIYKSENFHAEEARSILSILSDQETPAIVCAAYASLEKALIGKLNEFGYKGLDCQLATYFDCGNKGKSAYHCFCIVDIDDKKYNVQGKYYEDATKDAPTEKVRYQQAFNFFMLPICDLAKIKKTQVLEADVQFMQEIVSYLINKGSLKKMMGYKQAIVKRPMKIKGVYQPSYVLSLAGQGKAVDYQTMKEIIKNVYKKLLPGLSEERVESAYNYEIAMSIYFAKFVFKKDATNPFAVKANSMTAEEFEDIKNFVFPSEEIIAKLQEQIVQEQNVAGAEQKFEERA